MERVAIDSFIVVINSEQQYSIWPTDRVIPTGWSEAGVRGSRAECLAHIDRVWLDMRPLSVRNAVELNDSQPRNREQGSPP
jgi:MbtH protein